MFAPIFRQWHTEHGFLILIEFPDSRFDHIRRLPLPQHRFVWTSAFLWVRNLIQMDWLAGTSQNQSTPSQRGKHVFQRNFIH